ncbi:MAG: hypothetical protein OXB96_03210 [Candidatus Kaiserbacteria bacterium]|nr:hypothetical protein [Candidatus Kaiserbacteria bacterium]
MTADTTTQAFVPLRDIQNGVITRDDGVLCAVLLVSSVNFNLKSADERQAILYQFQSILNSLEVGIQILVQSRRLNIKPYLQYLEEVYEKQTIELLRLQTREYINFITDFTERNEIMTKQFFVVVSYAPGSSGGGLPFFGKKEQLSGQKVVEEHVTQLLQRVSFIQNNIRALGLRAVQLGTEEVTELLYKTFNPGDTQTPPSTQSQ